MICYSLERPYNTSSSKDIRMFLKKPTARRALSELGISDSKANLKMAETLFTITAEQFMKKWNFDPIRCCPLTPGRYQWTPARPLARRPHLQEQDAPWQTAADPTLHQGDAATLFLEGAEYVTRLPGEGRPVTRYLQEEDRCCGHLQEESRCCSHLQEEARCCSHLQEESRCLKTRRTHNKHTPRTKQCKITGKSGFICEYLLIYVV